ncbi:hypothetical protein [Rhodococcus sp. ACPA1]|uniref:hypothetical protein n=1 Tax=Rhodococcus sp. ACPA1 TaxID=2028572 RepID=UPI00211CDD9A|nr:hypothetical protein [Rhodococcus sp. ACPA1]
MTGIRGSTCATRFPTWASRSARALLTSCRIVSARPGAGKPAVVWTVGLPP